MGHDFGTTRNGNTLLHDAALNGDSELARLCLDVGIDPEARNRQGRTAASLATQKELPTIELSMDE